MVKIWHSRGHGLGSCPSQRATPPVSWVSYCGGCMWLGYWKLCHQDFKHRQGPPWWTGFSGASRLRQTRKKDLATHFQKNWLWKPYEQHWQQSIGWYSMGGWERTAQKDWAGFCSAVHRVPSSWNWLDSTNNNHKNTCHGIKCNKYIFIMFFSSLNSSSVYYKLLMFN